MMPANPLAKTWQARISQVTLVKNASWTIASYGINNVLRVVSSIILAKLLAPQLFGVMLIVNTLRTGFELVSDVGIGQNIVFNRNAEDPDFYNTAWSLQVLRGLILWTICTIIAVPLARIYNSPILALVMPAAALVSVLMGTASISLFLLRKRLQIARLNSFEMLVAALSTVAQIVIAYLSPTIWGLVGGSIIGCALTTIGSYFLLSDVKQRFLISKKYVREILSFGKWIYLSSFIYFLSMNFDRLYLAKIIPLALLGVYGIARNISELLSTLILHLGSLVVFPFIASHSHVPHDELRGQLAAIRLRFLLIAAIGISVLASTADLLIKIVYDQRYQEAGWMLPVLIVGAWFSILSSLNDATLLGFGKPNYGAIGNSFKFAFLVFGLIFSMTKFGIFGGVIVVAIADLFRYIPIYIGQSRERFSFGAQDLLATLVVFGMVGVCQYLRHALGFGTSFDAW
jgi:O-antigen/teichoic acid export membrane protein